MSEKKPTGGKGKINGVKTTSTIATLSSKTLTSPKSSKLDKRLAGGDLSNAKKRTK